MTPALSSTVPEAARASRQVAEREGDAVEDGVGEGGAVGGRGKAGEGAAAVGIVVGGAFAGQVGEE